MMMTVSSLGKEDTDENISEAVPERKDMSGCDTASGGEVEEMRE